MKKHFLSYISVLLLALLFGCEKDTGTSGSSPVCFYLSPEPSTRATDTEFEKGDAIGVLRPRVMTSRFRPNCILPVILQTTRNIYLTVKNLYRMGKATQYS